MVALTMREAAYEVLKAAGQPRHYKEVLEVATEHGLVNTQSLTPGQALISAIVRENKSRELRGELPRFEQLGNGVYGLTEWRPIGIKQRISEINQETRAALRDLLSNKVTAKNFEVLVSELLINIGLEEDSVEVKGRSGDGGIDIVGKLKIEGDIYIDVAVQVKKVKSNISPDKITALRGSLLPHQRGIFVTTSDFTRQAVAEANARGKSPISLINGDQVIDLMLQYEMGVKCQEYKVYEVDEDYWPPATTEESTVSPVNSNISYPLPIFKRFHQKIIDATLLETGEVLVGAQVFRSVSAAAIAVTGWKSCNGWRFWLFTHPDDGKEYILDVLRQTESFV